MKVGMIMRRHVKPDARSVMPEVARLLREWGIDVHVLDVEHGPVELASIRVEHDLYVIKDKSPLALSLAGTLHALGATMLNPYPVTALLRDKIVTTRILQAAGVPVPATYLAARPSDLAVVLADGPVIVKPYRGSRGAGVQVVRSSAELAAVASCDEPLFAQRYHQPEGRDYKIYCIGGQLFGVRRVWPPQNLADKLGEPFTITPELRDLAVRCGTAFGIDLYGLDVIVSDGRPYVVDMSSLPGFKGVPDATLRLAEYVYAAGQRALLDSSSTQSVQGR